jgi:hypothetical protein
LYIEDNCDAGTLIFCMVLHPATRKMVNMMLILFLIQNSKEDAKYANSSVSFHFSEQIRLSKQYG